MLPPEACLGLRGLGPSAIHRKVQSEFEQFLDLKIASGQRCIHVIVDGPRGIGRADASEGHESTLSPTKARTRPDLTEDEVESGCLKG